MRSASLVAAVLLPPFAAIHSGRASVDAFIIFDAFVAPLRSRGGRQSRLPASHGTTLCAKKAKIKNGGGLGGGGGDGGGGFGGGIKVAVNKKSAKSISRKGKGNLLETLNDDASSKTSAKSAQTYVKSEQDALLRSLAARSAQNPLGRVVASSPLYGTQDMDPFWELVPSLVASKFPSVADDQLERIAAFVEQTLDPDKPLEDSIVADEWRPHDEIHAYMPGLGPTSPFHDPDQLQLCRDLSDNYETIKAEYEALLSDMEKPGGKDRFQSVTSMNYEAGWRTLVLFYNGHRIDGFPYHLCPVTTSILESVPLAGRIAGFNRQRPGTGIPLHSDGNNMWLTCQMGIKVPEGEKAHIRVGPVTRTWKEGECLLYDTTYEHETFNAHPTSERVVLHVDFFNTLAMTHVEIEIMRYIYSMREEFMKAEGIAKVGAQIL